MASMKSIVFTIGFTRKSAEEFFRLLQDAGVKKLIDVRENRIGQLAGFAKFPDIAFLLDRILGIAYLHEPRLAPSAEIRQAYRKTKDWPAYERSFIELMRERKISESIDPSQFEGEVALLCSEATPEKCHRRLIAEYLAQYWETLGHHIEIRHLIIEKPVPPRKKRAKKNNGTHPL